MPAYRPVRRDYTPGYPRQLSEAELNEFLRPALFKRFSRETLAASALMLGAMFTQGCSAPPPKPLPKKWETTEDFDAKLTTLLLQLSGWRNNAWRATEQIYPEELYTSELLPANPPMKHAVNARVMVSFGTGGVTVMDMGKLRDDTCKIFEFYGIPLEKDVKLAENGYRFTADGYSEDYGIGFEGYMRAGGGIANSEAFKRKDWLIMARQWLANQGGWLGQQASLISLTNPAEHLDDHELAPLNTAISEKKTQLFVPDFDNYGSMDLPIGTLAYLLSVVDYLNAVTGHATYDPTQIVGLQLKDFVFDDVRTGLGTSGMAFDNEESLAQCTVEKGHATFAESFNNRKSIELHIEPGGRAVFKLPPHLRHMGRVVVSLGLDYDPLEEPIPMKVCAANARETTAEFELAYRSETNYQVVLDTLALDGAIESLSLAPEISEPIVLRLIYITVNPLPPPV